VVSPFLQVRPVSRVALAGGVPLIGLMPSRGFAVFLECAPLSAGPPSFAGRSELRFELSPSVRRRDPFSVQIEPQLRRSFPHETLVDVAALVFQKMVLVPGFF